MTKILTSFKESTVLVCDDDITHLILMRETLESEGFKVIEASDGEVAYRLFKEQQPDLVMLDVHMPHMTGFQVCEKIRSHVLGFETPVLMVTGADDFDSIKQAFEVGATDFLPKPIKWPMIGYRVRYMLRSRLTLKELKKSEDQLRYLAYFDTLTGLPNRTSFSEHLQRFLSLAKRKQSRLAIMLIDLDRFKRINDTLGHDFGDELLRKVAERLAKCVRESDLAARNSEQHYVDHGLARLGGDEFTVLLNQMNDVSEAGVVAQRIIDQISEPIMINGYEVIVTPSVGISVFPDDADNATDLIKFADIAMYKAKEAGRQQYIYFCDTFNVSTAARLNLEKELRQAIDEGQLTLHYQPKVGTDSNTVVGAEALVRWHHPTRGMVMPGEFIPIAEETGVIVKLGEWVLQQACKQISQWIKNDSNVCPISVNVSGLQFKQTAIPELIAELINKYSIPPGLLEIELTESAIMTDVNDNIERLKQISELGVIISIDDFGTGYSSLSYLKRFPINVLKIDRSFIIDVAQSSDDRGIVDAIIRLSDSLRLKVIAEGVETREQLNTLKTLGCTMIQGYLFAKPMPADTFAELLNDKAAMTDMCLLTHHSEQN